MRNRIVLSIGLGLSAMLAAACEEPPSPIPQEAAGADLIPGEGSASAEKASATFALASSSDRYDRERAVWYARRYAEDPNPLFAYCANRWTGRPADCTNFVSQALWYGGLRMEDRGGGGGWWYRSSCRDGGSSFAWRQVNALIYWLTVESRRGRFGKIEDVRPGDLVFYKLPETDGSCSPEFVFHHSTMVTGFGPSGTPLVSYHTREIRDIPWNWSLRESGYLGLGDACGYAAVHIDE